MTAIRKEKTIIGRAEKIKFPELDGFSMHARIDTGAQTSSIGIVSARETPKGLEVIFSNDTCAPSVTKTFHHFERVVIASSMGQQQTRYKIRLAIVMRGRRIRTTFTLADRSTQVYPVLIGRRALNNKFIVDVSIGSPLREKERVRSQMLQSTVISEEKI